MPSVGVEIYNTVYTACGYNIAEGVKQAALGCDRNGSAPRRAPRISHAMVTRCRVWQTRARPYYQSESSFIAAKQVKQKIEWLAKKTNNDRLSMVLIRPQSESLWSFFASKKWPTQSSRKWSIARKVRTRPRADDAIFLSRVVRGWHTKSHTQRSVAKYMIRPPFGDLAWLSRRFERCLECPKHGGVYVRRHICLRWVGTLRGFRQAKGASNACFLLHAHFALARVPKGGVPVH